VKTPAISVKCAVVEPAATTTVGARTMRAGLSLDIATDMGELAGAALLKVTVQLVIELIVKLVGEHCSDGVSTTRGRATDWEEPAKVAVTVAVCSVLKALVVARNDPLPEPEGIVSEAGTVRLGELELRLTVPPPDPLRTTVHVLEALGAKVPGLHAMELIPAPAATLTMPPVPVTAIASPVNEAPTLLPMAIGTALLPDGVTDRVAMTPLEITSEFNPHAIHAYELVPAAQVMVLPADDNAGPAVTLQLPTLAAG
jgi:hypothetical protein